MPDDKKTTTLDDNDYASRIRAAKQGSVPVGGAPMPHIPPLDRTTHEQAAYARARNLTPEQIEELKKQGRFIPGVGSGLAMNQPKIEPPAAKQEQAPEEKSDGEPVNPPRPGGPILRPETEQQLKEFEKATKDAQENKDNKKVLEELEEIGDEFDFDEFGNKVRNLLVNKERRDVIEARCTPMKLEDLLIQQEVKQVVPIVPGKFEPTFRSMQGSEDLFVKRQMVGERGDTRYVLDRFSLMNLTCGLYAINNKPLPSHLDKDGEPDEQAFNKKFKFVLKYPISLLVDLSVNYGWFERRVRKLMAIEAVKGF
jgi:hypothetical protein